MPGPTCASCGTASHNGYGAGLCGRCAHTALVRRVTGAPADFWQREPQRTALANDDFGTAFRLFRHHAGPRRISQEELGLLIGIPQKLISEYETHKRQVEHLATARRFAVALGIPADLLGFPSTSTAGGTPTPEDAMGFDRRGFLNTVLALSMGTMADLDLDRLRRLLPAAADAPVPRTIGTADVEVIETFTQFLREHDYQHGGGLLRAAAQGQLSIVEKLDQAAGSESVRASLRLAIADLASVSAWMAYDTEDHDDARRLWTTALGHARRAGHPRSADFVAHVQLDMANQAMHLKRPEEALQLVQLAAIGRRPPGAGTRSYIQSYLGWSYAALGEEDASARAFDQSRTTWAAVKRTDMAPWDYDMTDAEFDALNGHSLYLLSRTMTSSTQRARRAEPAVRLLTAAVNGYGPAYSRSIALNTAGLAGAHLQLGDRDAAVRTGLLAVEAITDVSLSSRRAFDRLRRLDQDAQAHAEDPGVAELRHRIQLALSAPVT